VACSFSAKTREAYALSLLEGGKKAAAAKHIATCEECKALIIERRRNLNLLDEALLKEQEQFLTQQKQVRKRVVTSVVYAVIAIAGFGLLLHFGMNVRPKRLITSTAVVQPGVGGKQNAKRRRNAEVAAEYATGSDLHNNNVNEGERAPSETPSLQGLAGPLLNLYLVNPVTDRTIYRELGVAEHIAGLLL